MALPNPNNLSENDAKAAGVYGAVVGHKLLVTQLVIYLQYWFIQSQMKFLSGSADYKKRCLGLHKDTFPDGLGDKYLPLIDIELVNKTVIAHFERDAPLDILPP